MGYTQLFGHPALGSPESHTGRPKFGTGHWCFISKPLVIIVFQIYINNSRRASYGYDQRIEVFGARGMLLAGNQRATTVEAWSGAGTQTRDAVLDFFIERYAAAYADEIDHFVTCVMDGGTPLAGFADGVAALRLADAAVESAASGRTIRVGRESAS